MNNLTISDDYNGFSQILFNGELLEAIGIFNQNYKSLINEVSLGKKELDSRKSGLLDHDQFLELNLSNKEYNWALKLSKIFNLIQDQKTQKILIHLPSPHELENNFCIDGKAVPTSIVLSYLLSFHLKQKDSFVFKIDLDRNSSSFEFAFWNSLFSQIETFLGLMRNSISIQTNSSPSVVYNLNDALLIKNKLADVYLCGA